MMVDRLPTQEMHHHPASVLYRESLETSKQVAPGIAMHTPTKEVLCCLKHLSLHFLPQDREGATWTYCTHKAMLCCSKHLPPCLLLHEGEWARGIPLASRYHPLTLCCSQKLSSLSLDTVHNLSSSFLRGKGGGEEKLPLGPCLQLIKVLLKPCLLQIRRSTGKVWLRATNKTGCQFPPFSLYSQLTWIYPGKLKFPASDLAPRRSYFSVHAEKYKIYSNPKSDKGTGWFS